MQLLTSQSARVSASPGGKFSPITTDRPIQSTAAGILCRSTWQRLLSTFCCCLALGAGFSAHLFAAAASSVTLAWNANPETDITGYQLKYGTTSGVYPNAVSVGTIPTTSVSGLTEGTTYYFVVTAINQAGIESAPSSQISHQVAVSGPTNQAPVALSKTVTTAEDSPLAIVLGGTDADNNPLTFAVITNPAKGTLSGTVPNLSYLPSANSNGSDSFTFRVNDGKVNSATATVSITITPVNDAPVAATKAVTAKEDTQTPIALGGADVDANSLSFSIVAPPAKGTLSGVAPNLSYLPSADYNGSDSFSFRVNDGTVNSATATVSITVAPVNDPPVATARAVTTNEDTPVAIVLSGSDKETSSLSSSVVTGPTKGTLSGTVPNLRYSPSVDYNGSDSFTFRVNDGTVNSATATVSITVAPVNDAPVATAKAVTATKNTSLPIVLGGSDKEAGSLSFSVVVSPTHGTISGIAPNLTYQPATDFVGADQLTFRVNDGKVNSTNATVSITVAPVNLAPVFSLNPMVYPAGKEKIPYLNQSLASTATDPNAGDSITYSKFAGPAWLTISQAGILGGTPLSGSAGTNTFTVRATDSAGAYTDATLQIQINANTLALPWNLSPIGSGNLNATAAYQAGVFTLGGSGALSKTTDTANFVWQTLSRDGEIIARVRTLGNTGKATRVGVMIRESLAPNSRQMFIGISDAGNYLWLRRTGTGVATKTIADKGPATGKTWLRLVRKANTLTAYRSSNGTSWTLVGKSTLTLPKNCYIGLSVSSGSDVVLNTSKFSNVRVVR